MNNKVAAFILIAICIFVIASLIISSYIPKYESEISVTEYSEIKGFIAGRVIKSNHLSPGTNINCAISTEDNKIYANELGKKDVHIIIKYNATANEELLPIYSSNPVDLRDIKAVEIKRTE